MSNEVGNQLNSSGLEEKLRAAQENAYRPVTREEMQAERRGSFLLLCVLVVLVVGLLTILGVI